MTQEPEKLVEGGTPVVEPTSMQPTPKVGGEGSVSLSSVIVPQLGSGPIEEHADEPDVWEAEPGSGELLEIMASPQVFEGPEVDLQKDIVVKLEKAIPILDAEYQKTRDAVQIEIDKLDAEYGKVVPRPAKETAVYNEKRQQLTRQQPPTLLRDILYLGSIVLTDIPRDATAEADLINEASMEKTDFALPPNDDGTAVTEAAGVEKAVIRNTLQTMIKAGQMQYLRKAGFVGQGWKIIVEVHYYRNRAKGMNGIHKDTKGETLFVNLNYTNDTTMPGPEWIENPPTYDVHQKHLETSLPEEFNEDLARIHDKPHGTRIQTEDMPPNGVVAFIDEAVHHATPMLGHRTVKVERLKVFLTEDADFKDVYAKAQKAYGWSTATGLWTIRGFNGTFESNMGKTYPEQQIQVWKALMTLCQKPNATELRRPELLDIGMTNPQIDRLVSGYGSPFHNSVQIPGEGRTDNSSGRLPIRAEGATRPMTLQRTMSERALKKALPVDPGGERRFFRTWVRVVRTSKSAEGPPRGGLERKRAEPTTPATPIVVGSPSVKTLPKLATTPHPGTGEQS